MMQLISGVFFGVSCLTLALAVLARVADRAVLGLSPRALLEVSRTILLLGIAAALI